MDNKKFKKLEEKAVEIFGERATMTFSQIRVAYKGYLVRIKVQGMPFEISSFKPTLEEAEELAISKFYEEMDKALKDNLFQTKPQEQYEVRNLTDNEFEKLFKFEECMGEEYLEELKSKTIIKICELEDGRYECVIESPYMNLHARATSKNKTMVPTLAIWTAHDIFKPILTRVGDKL